NKTLRYLCQDVEMRCENASTPWTSLYRRGQGVTMPIGHGEGNYTAPPEILDAMRRREQIVFPYCGTEGPTTEAANPNGSEDAIAGICNAAGNVVGLMPHPDRCAEAVLGNDAGLALFRSCVEAVAAGRPAAAVAAR